MKEEITIEDYNAILEELDELEKKGAKTSKARKEIALLLEDKKHPNTKARCLQVVFMVKQNLLAQNRYGNKETID